MTDFASLGIRIDTAQVASGVRDLEKLTVAGKTAETATKGLEAASTSAAQAVSALGAATQKAGTANTSGLGAVAQSLTTTATQAKAAQTAVAGLTAATNGAAPAAAKATQAFGQFAAGQKLTAHQSQQLSFQLNDLFVQIASGQSPLTALIQQGSQLNGTFGGVGGTLRALASVFTATRVAIGGLVGVIGGVAAAFAIGAKESSDFQKAILLTGNAAGITEGQFNSLAKTLAASTNTTIGSTRETIQALVASGRFSGEALTQSARAVQNLSKVTGQSNDDIVASFVKMSGGIANWAAETNKQYNFLTAAQLAYIRTLEEQGNAQKAIEVTMNALNGRIEAAAGSLGTLERGWNAVKNAASRAIDAMLQIGRAPTPQESIGSIQAQIDALDNRKSLNPSVTAARRAALTEQLTAAQALTKETERAAKASSDAILTERAKTDFMKLQEQSLSRQEQRAKEIAKANALADKAGASPAERAKVIANINEKFKDPKGSSAKGPDTTRVDARAALLLRIEDIKSAGQSLILEVQNQDKILEAKRAAGLLNEEEYYGEKKRLLEANTQAQVDTLQKENELLEQQKLNTKDGLDRDRQVLKNKQEIAKLQAGVATNLQVIAIQQEAAAKRIEVALLSARQAAQDYFDVVQRANDREVAGVGKGNKARGFDSGITSIEDKFRQQRRDLENNKAQAELAGTFNADAQKLYEGRLALLEEFQGKEIDSYKKKYAKLDELQKDWTVGATEALQNYYDESQNIAKQFEEVFSNAFRGLEDTLVEFVSTGKGDFKSLVDSIQKDLLRISIKESITGPLANLLKDGIKGEGALGGILGAFGLGGKGGSVAGAGAAAATTAATTATTAFTASIGAASAAVTAALSALSAAATAAAASLGGSSVGGLFGGESGDVLGDFLAASGRAIGGPVSSGNIYRINERGPGEVFEAGGKQYLLAGMSGEVKPASNDSGWGGGGRTTVLHYHAAQGESRATTQQNAAAAARQLRIADARNN